MKVEQRKSGLIVPAEKPRKPSRQYGVLEITNDSHREKVRSALGVILESLNSTNLFRHTGGAYVAQRAMFDLLATSLLGDDACWEEKC